ncbi:MAG: hypothetical protein K9J16_08310 [Melioribacteraceae bacterium]|nr:hypothetical protein [Melioribacteraceae bacterium]MCF8353173.1 hypothetical protein [Melioribacteraceae bacterium]MCF8395163.1 hypothetical protein [Melioribacteraceae bacterium]MCF8418030.1 hypothetical protein [Melioribacteraceae bacterium]
MKDQDNCIWIGGTEIESLHKFDLEPSDIKINKQFLYQSLGYQNEIPEPVLIEIDKTIDYLNALVEIQAGFKLISPERVKFHSGYILIDDERLNTKAIIGKKLVDSETLAIFVATLGSRLEEKSKKLMSEGDLLQGYILDAVGSELVEQTTDWLQLQVENLLSENNLKITNRYSPGYCGWNVVDQQIIFSFLPKLFCGIKLSESSLMVPIKSVSGVIGIGKNVIKSDYECSICDMTNCSRRRVM